MEQILSIIRTVLIAVGGFLIGHTVLGQNVDTNWIEVSVGGILALTGGIWSWISKQLGPDQKISIVRTGLTFIGGLIVSAGWVSDTLWQQIVGLAVTLATIIIGNQVKAKNY